MFDRPSARERASSSGNNVSCVGALPARNRHTAARI